MPSSGPDAEHQSIPAAVPPLLWGHHRPGPWRKLAANQRANIKRPVLPRLLGVAPDWEPSILHLPVVGPTRSTRLGHARFHPEACHDKPWTVPRTSLWRPGSCKLQPTLPWAARTCLAAWRRPVTNMARSSFLVCTQERGRDYLDPLGARCWLLAWPSFYLCSTTVGTMMVLPGITSIIRSGRSQP